MDADVTSGHGIQGHPRFSASTSMTAPLAVPGRHLRVGTSGGSGAMGRQGALDVLGDLLIPNAPTMPKGPAKISILRSFPSPTPLRRLLIT